MDIIQKLKCMATKTVACLLWSSFYLLYAEKPSTQRAVYTLCVLFGGFLMGHFMKVRTVSTL